MEKFVGLWILRDDGRTGLPNPQIAFRKDGTYTETIDGEGFVGLKLKRADHVEGKWSTDGHVLSLTALRSPVMEQALEHATGKSVEELKKQSSQVQEPIKTTSTLSVNFLTDDIFVWIDPTTNLGLVFYRANPDGSPKKITPPSTTP